MDMDTKKGKKKGGEGKSQVWIPGSIPLCPVSLSLYLPSLLSLPACLSLSVSVSVSDLPKKKFFFPRLLLPFFPDRSRDPEEEEKEVRYGNFHSQFRINDNDNDTGTYTEKRDQWT